ncbi:Processing of GAS1 and ALP protein 2 [Cyberlindnera fabianii]|uniref:Processing of GAS1 and ALP protein 2 n=2 Tax=Cyberlindnera fabianii TaxID=36022 RepID=A0A1V2LCA4_CYBFA|nr:Processing of GAS1 and ALP protein 2 [Cyberlindnera fabianii]
MDVVTNFIEKLTKPFQEMDLQHGIRLIIIIGGYWFLRQAAQRYLAKRQLEQQVEADKQGKTQQNLQQYMDGDNDDESATTTGTEAKWGWGKKTRKNVKKQQQILQETLENMHAAAQDDDKDIADLLED